MNSHRLVKMLAAFVLAALAVVSSPVFVPGAFAQVSVLTDKYDNARDGQNASETLLSSTTVTTSQFGKLSTFNLDGYVQAQPLYMYALNISGGTHNVVFVATLNNSVYAIDADTSTQLWQVNLGTPVPSATEGCSGVTGFNQVGIVGTPVIDNTTNTLYVVAKTYTSGSAAHTLHALDVTTGLEKFNGPVSLNASIGTLNFSNLQQIQRPAILESNGNIYIGFGSNGCDYNARGWLFAYSASNLQQTPIFMTTQPDNSYGSSLWQGGVGPAADSNGNVFLSTANGVFNFSANDLGDSILRLTLGATEFSVADSFTPYDQANMAANDIDLGSAGPILLPSQAAAGSTTPDLLVASGKDADLYLVNRDNMSGYNATNEIVQYIPNALAGEFFGAPLYWNNYVYFLAHQDYLRSFALTTPNGVSTLTASAMTTGKLTNFALPVISANGTTSGIVWLVRNVKGVPLLSAYDAVSLFLLYDTSMAAGGRDTLGTVGHYATPTVVNGKVFVGTASAQSQLVTYGLFPALVPTTGNGQIGAAGTTLPTAIEITATNPYTRAPISGVNVTFSDGGKGGVFSSPTGTTDVNGLASTTYTLPKTPQTITITVTSSGYAPATFTESGIVGPVASIATVSGGKQSGTVGTTLPAPIVVKAKDAYGNLEVGALILFADGGAGGVFSNPNPVATGTNGEASITYTLPLKAKSITVTASNGSVSDRITESALAGPPALVNIIQGNNQSAHIHNKLPKALIVSVTDQYGNGLPGLTVNFTDNGAGGTFSNANPITGTTGQVSVTYTTPSVTGPVTIDASYGSLSPAVFSETVD
jgi:outer membrane protein assembly factor BamB